MDKEGFGVYGALDRTFGDPNMASGDLKLNDSSDAAAGNHFSPPPGPGMDSISAADAVDFSGRMMHHPLFDGAAPCHCLSSGCLVAAPLAHVASVGGRIFYK